MSELQNKNVEKFISSEANEVIVRDIKSQIISYLMVKIELSVKRTIVSIFLHLNQKPITSV